MSEIIQLTETSRLRVEQDEDASNPRTNGDYQMTGFVNIPNLGDRHRIDVAAIREDPTSGLIHAMSGLNNDDALVTRWARSFHDLTVEYDSEHGGFWFVDPDEFTKNWPHANSYEESEPYAIQRYRYTEDVLLTKPELEAKIIEQEQEQYRRWANGEVFGVILERKVAWAKLSADGGTVLQGEGTVRETWEDADSIWGCYLDDIYTAQVVAREYLNLTDEEEEACQ